MRNRNLPALNPLIPQRSRILHSDWSFRRLHFLTQFLEGVSNVSDLVLVVVVVVVGGGLVMRRLFTAAIMYAIDGTDFHI